MANAITPRNARKPLNITLTTYVSFEESPTTTEFYLYMHFAELQTLQANETREFNILIDGQIIISNPYSPKFLAADTIEDTRPQKCDGGKCKFELVKTWGSNLPPLINAIEGFIGIDFSLLETNGEDGMSI